MDTGNLFNKRDKCEKCNGHGWYRIGEDEIRCQVCDGSGIPPLKGFDSEIRSGWVRPSYVFSDFSWDGVQKAKKEPEPLHTVEAFLNSDESRRWIFSAYAPSERVIFDAVMKDRTAFKKAYNWMIRKYDVCYVDATSGRTYVYLNDKPMIGAAQVIGHLFAYPIDKPYRILTRED